MRTIASVFKQKREYHHKSNQIQLLNSFHNDSTSENLFTSKSPDVECRESILENITFKGIAKSQIDRRLRQIGFRHYRKLPEFSLIDEHNDFTVHENYIFGRIHHTVNLNFMSYDYIIIGGEPSGVSLAVNLARKFPHRTVCLVDPGSIQRQKLLNVSLFNTFHDHIPTNDVTFLKSNDDVQLEQYTSFGGGKIELLQRNTPEVPIESMEWATSTLAGDVPRWNTTHADIERLDINIENWSHKAPMNLLYTNTLSNLYIFNEKVDSVFMQNQRIQGVLLTNSRRLFSSQVTLCAGTIRNVQILSRSRINVNNSRVHTNAYMSFRHEEKLNTVQEGVTPKSFAYDNNTARPCTIQAIETNPDYRIFWEIDAGGVLNQNTHINTYLDSEVRRIVGIEVFDTEGNGIITETDIHVNWSDDFIAKCRKIHKSLQIRHDVQLPFGIDYGLNQTGSCSDIVDPFLFRVIGVFGLSVIDTSVMDSPLRINRTAMSFGLGHYASESLF